MAGAGEPAAEHGNHLEHNMVGEGARMKEVYSSFAGGTIDSTC